MTVHGTVLVQCAFRFQTAIDLFDIIFQEKVIGFHECLPTVFQTKKSVPYFLGCNKAVALHDFLIMPCDSCAELVEQPVGLPCRHAFSYGATALDTPECRIDGDLAAELCLCAIHGDAPHDGRCAVFLDLVFLQIEDD